LPSGSLKVSPLETTTYTGKVKNAVGSSTCSFTLSVKPAEVVIPITPPKPAAVAEKVKEVVKPVQEFTAKEEVQKVGKTITWTGLVIALLSGLAALLPRVFTFSEIILIIPAILGFRKKIMPWGIVYDAQTKRPLDPVYVTLKTEKGKVVQEKITDMEGKYGFLAPPGVYTIEAKKTHYRFPSQIIKENTDWLYENIYRGEKFVIEKEAQVINLNIPMDNFAIDWNELAKTKITQFNPYLEAFKKHLPRVVFYGCFLVTLLITIFNPSPLNTGLTISYLAFGFLRFKGFKEKSYGIIYDKEKQQPLPFAKIRAAFPSMKERTIAHTIADEVGRYYLVIPKGQYYLEIEGKTVDGKEIKSSLEVNVKTGVLNQNLKI